MKAWGGISSLQFGLSAMYTAGVVNRGCRIRDIVRWMSEAPARLLGVDKRKGQIDVGFDADFVILDASKQFEVKKEDIVFKNKFSAYEGSVLTGVVTHTILRGQVLVNNGKMALAKPAGELLLVSRSSVKKT